MSTAATVEHFRFAWTGELLRDCYETCPVNKLSRMESWYLLYNAFSDVKAGDTMIKFYIV
jgi:hypothetical protein